MTANKNRSSWKREYVRILQLGIEGSVTLDNQSNQLDLARELIESEYLVGTFNLQENMKADMVFIKYLTTSGRLFLEQLEDELKKETLIYRIKVFSIALFSWAGGVITAYLTSIFNCT